MRPRDLVALAVVVAFTIWVTWQAKTLETHLIHSIIQPGEPGPSFRLAALDGRTISSAQLRGKGKLVVSFWASWCRPCREELPALAALYRKTHKAGSGYEMVAISEDAVPEAARRAAARMKLPFTVLEDPSGATLAAYGVQGIPALFVIDEQGAIRQEHVGYQAGVELVLARELGLDYNPLADAYGNTGH